MHFTKYPVPEALATVTTATLQVRSPELAHQDSKELS